MKKEMESLVAKAQRSLKAARRLFEERDYDFAASRAYYAMFYLAEALLMKKGITFSKHGGVIAGLYEQYVKRGLLSQSHHQALHRAFEARSQGDYGFQEPFPREEAKVLLGDAKAFLEEAMRLLRME